MPKTQLDEFGHTPLHYAAADGDVAAVDRLLATEDVNLADHEGWTPLHFVASAGAPDVVTRLLDTGADVHALTEKGMPAIYWAAVTNRGDPVATIRVLRARGADPTRITIKGSYNIFPAHSPLHCIMSEGHPAEIRSEFADLLDERQSRPSA
ncbi:ankyrin repeat domain-containing protein [Nocardia concava]|uniref:ankyrin repeat domain-containing protein n=1 Tax=Nocardia concava TaxID=257281 RepID=UPI0002F4F5D5|nr:ankyrin repeat domain-containing protein [Nocardia concava]